MAYVCAAAIFLSAFLLFQVQPLIARQFLPWFGGLPSVWTTCMLFFQCLLLAGYGYSHWMAQKVAAKRQVQIHGGLLIAVSLLLGAQTIIWGAPLLPGMDWAPNAEGSPLIQLLSLLALSTGLPYLLLSTTGPLLQSWFARAYPSRSVYRLYALSNAGSLLALLSYPIFVEPFFRLRTQGARWGALFVLFVALCLLFGLRTQWCFQEKIVSDKEKAPGKSSDARECLEAPHLLQWLSWIVLAMIPSAMLLAVTNHISQEVAPIPFLWVVPMVIYLGSFILTFESDYWYRRPVFIALFCLSALIAVNALYLGHVMPLGVQVVAFLALLFATCMICHGEMARRRPAARYLTSFYLSSSIGGAVGGLFVGVAAPMLFLGYWELNLSIIAAWIAVLLTPPPRRRGKLVKGLGACWLVFLMLALGAEMLPKENDLERFRDFYGKYSVDKTVDKENRVFHRLFHGKTLHGVQRGEPREMIPLTYYSEQSGVGRLFRDYQKFVGDKSLKVGIVGLGVGTLAAYARAKDEFVFYELVPNMIELARGRGGYFSFLQDAAAAIETVPGDARIALDRELREKGSRQYDLLIIDAFSSDSIPAHLLTLEAFDLYLKHLAPEGVIAVHISNRFIDLNPILRMAAHQKDSYYSIVAYDIEGNWVTPSLYSFLTPSSRVAQALTFAKFQPGRLADGSPELEKMVLWTDDYTPLLPMIQWME